MGYLPRSAIEGMAGGGGGAWGDISGKPATFAPTLPLAQSDITGLVAALSGKEPAVGTVNTDTGTFGGVATVPQISVNGKGQVTGVTAVAIDFSGYVTTSALTSGLSGKENAGVAGGLIAALTKASVGLADADNTADTAKPVSTAQQAALNLKAPLANPQFTGTAFFAQPTPTSLSATATLTIAQLLTLIINATGTTAKNFTLPTGTLTDAGILGGALAVGQAFEWYLINTGTSSGTATLLAGTGHTIVGAALTAIGTSSRWFTRKTAANTFVTYRIG